MLRLDQIRTAIAARTPILTPPRDRPEFEAAVALILYQAENGKPELLFIERAKHKGDPWSGHMAFPGGRREPEDRDLAMTAARETLEEVGIELGDPFGQLDEFSGGPHRVRPLLVAPYVYEVAKRPIVTPNYEVNDTVWVPLHWMLDPASASEYNTDYADGPSTLPALRYQHYTVWGMTYRFLGSFFEILGEELPSKQSG